MSTSQIAIYAIASLATLGIIIRPWRLPEYVWACSGALLLVALGLLPVSAGLAAVAKGGDVYLFLAGMMLLAEVCRQEGVFDYLASHAVRHAAGSPHRLFAIVYGVGTLVTIFMSNDATAVVLTPAVYAAARAAKAEPLPYLFICAFIANAASFVLPISNPANLVIFGSHMPPLPIWLHWLGLPSLLAIGATYGVLALTQRAALRGRLAESDDAMPLSTAGRLAAWGTAIAAVVLVTASTLGLPLGLPTFLVGAGVTAMVHAVIRKSPLPVLRHVSWGVLPLVAGLFVLVEGLAHAGLLTMLGQVLDSAAHSAPGLTAGAAGLGVAVASNLINNLPMALIAGTAAHAANASPQLGAALTIGVDLGPNLSVTGSLATLLWLVALRREGLSVSAWRFLRVGLLVTPPALLLALGALVLAGH